MLLISLVENYHARVLHTINHDILHAYDMLACEDLVIYR